MSIWTFFGRWQHGGCHGLTKLAKQPPKLTELMCAMVRKAFPERDFSTIAVTEDTVFRPRRDKFNERGSSNLALGLSQYVGGGVWIHDETMRWSKQAVWRVAKEGADALPGRIMDTHWSGTAFDPLLGRCS